MNIPKAIEILEDIDASTDWPQSTLENDAIKLGIEALKWIRDYGEDAERLLPGETK